jgi:hypothetical protein
MNMNASGSIWRLHETMNVVFGLSRYTYRALKTGISCNKCPTAIPSKKNSTYQAKRVPNIILKKDLPCRLKKLNLYSTHTQQHFKAWATITETTLGHKIFFNLSLKFAHTGNRTRT